MNSLCNDFSLLLLIIKNQKQIVLFRSEYFVKTSLSFYNNFLVQMRNVYTLFATLILFTIMRQKFNFFQIKQKKQKITDCFKSCLSCFCFSENCKKLSKHN